MKKSVSFILFFFCSVCVLSAAKLKNEYQQVYENTYFAKLFDATNQNKSYEEVKKLYEEGVSNIQDTVTLIRLKLDYIEFVNNLKGKEEKKELKAILDTCYNNLEKLEKTGASALILDSLTFLVYGIEYRVTGNWNKGLISLKLIDNCYFNNKSDAGIMLLYAQRKAETPAIGGGDTNQALEVLLQLLEDIDSFTTGFKYKVYQELGSVYEKTDSIKSQYYYNLAKDLY